MSNQMIPSDLFVDLSTEQQQLLVGGQLPGTGTTPGVGTTPDLGLGSYGLRSEGRRFPIRLSGYLFI